MAGKILPITRSPSLRELVTVAFAAVAYFAAARLGLKLTFLQVDAAAICLPAGVALAAFLLLGYRIWPGILVGAFLANLTTEGSVAVSLGMGAGNTLEGLAGAYLVRRFAGGHQAFDRARDVFKFTILAAVLSTAIGATFGVTSRVLGHLAAGHRYGPAWLTWWFGDAASDLVLAPFLILWSVRTPARRTWLETFEAVALLFSLFLVGQVVFGAFFPSEVKDYPLEYLSIPFLIWAAFRFSQREAAAAILLLSGIAIWGTLHGYGPFARATQNESLFLLQAFIGVMAVTTLALAALVSERHRAETDLLRLAGTDPVTGLANYRRLIEVLGGEIRRSGRTGRPFAVLLLDVDNLKKINDRYGHLVGTRALWRLGSVLRGCCRSIDTASRFGGDEFALVLCESDEAAALQAADRICRRLAADREKPPLSASVGVAVYPRDGETTEALIEAADKILYRAKRSGGGDSALAPKRRFRRFRWRAK